jgi:DNA topoisomerase IA
MDQTLSAAQSLYEKHKLTTYPLSDSRHLPGSLRTQVQQSLLSLASSKSMPEGLVHRASALSKSPCNTAVFNNAKVSSHHAIIPTTETSFAKSLTPLGEKVYFLIYKQFVQRHSCHPAKRNRRNWSSHTVQTFSKHPELSRQRNYNASRKCFGTDKSAEGKWVCKQTRG